MTVPTNPDELAKMLHHLNDLGTNLAQESIECYGCDRPGTFQGVSGWKSDGSTIVEVPSCDEHTKCKICGKTLEISPISGLIECFLHGSAVD